MPSYSSSWVELCNRALGRLGASKIVDFSTGGTLSYYCNLYLSDAIEYVFSQFDWPFAKKRVQLAALSTPPVYGYGYAFPLPADYFRLIEVENNEQPYSVENGAILTDSDEVWITYIAQPSDPGLLPGYIKRAIETELAFLLTTPLTSSDAIAQRVMAERTIDMQRAKEVAAREYDEQTPEEERGFLYYEDVR